MAEGDAILRKRIRNFSKEPEEQARQTAELEAEVEGTSKRTEKRLKDIEDRLAALEQYNEENP